MSVHRFGILGCLGLIRTGCSATADPAPDEISTSAVPAGTASTPPPGPVIDLEAAITAAGGHLYPAHRALLATAITAVNASAVPTP